MAELASPESWCTGNGTVGSNPTPSAPGQRSHPLSAVLTSPQIGGNRNGAIGFRRSGVSRLRFWILADCGTRGCIRSRNPGRLPNASADG